MSKTYRVGIIGATGRGNYGHAVDEALAAMPEVAIVAVADADPAGREQAQKRLRVAKSYADFTDMLAQESLDIVGICPRWIDQHHAMLMAAADAGCHVYMEKPFCRTLQECDDVVRAFEMRHLHLGIAHIAEYSAVLDTVIALLRDGVIGDVLELRGRGKEDRRGGGEDLWVLGSHVFGMMRSLAGSAVTSCTASVLSNGRPITRADVAEGAEGIGLLAGDHVQAHYTFANGMNGYFASRRNMGGNPSRFGVQVFGSKGIIEFQSGYLAPAYVLRDSSWSPGRTGSHWEPITSAGIGQPEPRTDGDYQGGHMAAIRDLIHSIENHQPTRCSVEDCRAIVEMTAAIFESQRVGGRVALPLATRANPLSLLT